jgi:hypothetical protein
MNGIDEFVLAALGLFFGITVLMLALSYVERTLSEPGSAPERPVTGGQRAEGLRSLAGPKTALSNQTAKMIEDR